MMPAMDENPIALPDLTGAGIDPANALRKPEGPISIFGME